MISTAVAAYLLRSTPSSIAVTEEGIRIRGMRSAREIPFAGLRGAELLVESRYMTRRRDDRVYTVVLRPRTGKNIRWLGIEGMIGERLMQALPPDMGKVRIYAGSRMAREMSARDYLEKMLE